MFLRCLVANIDELSGDLAAHLVVRGSRDADATRLRYALKPCSDIDTVAENVVALDQDVPEIDPDPEQHTAFRGNSVVPFGHHGLHGYRAFDRIDDRGKLKQYSVSRGFHEATTIFCYQCIGRNAVLAECAGGADLVKTH